MIENIVKYNKNIIGDIGLYFSILIPLLVLVFLKSDGAQIIFDKKNIFMTSIAIIALSIGFCHQAFNYLTNLDAKSTFYKKLLKNEIFDEIRFLFTYNIFVSAVNVVVLTIFTILVWFEIINDSYLIMIALIPSFTTFYTLSEFINFYRTGVGLKKYELDFEKIHLND